jgi:hypothetical protein
MKKIVNYITNVPTLKLVIYCIALAHVFFSADSIASFGIGFTQDVHWRTWVVIVFTALYIGACSENRFFYYAYIGCVIVSMLIVFAIKDYTFYVTVFRVLFPMHLLFAAVLILDLQRVIFLAHRNRPTA